MPAKKLPKYMPVDLEEIKDNPYQIKREFDILLKFINSDFNRFIKKGIKSGGRRTRKKLLRLRTVSLYFYRAIGKLQEQRNQELKELKESFIFVPKNQ